MTTWLASGESINSGSSCLRDLFFLLLFQLQLHEAFLLDCCCRVLLSILFFSQRRTDVGVLLLRRRLSLDDLSVLLFFLDNASEWTLFFVFVSRFELFAAILFSNAFTRSVQPFQAFTFQTLSFKLLEERLKLGGQCALDASKTLTKAFEELGLDEAGQLGGKPLVIDRWWS
jgi:hypothetical protein